MIPISVRESIEAALSEASERNVRIRSEKPATGGCISPAAHLLTTDGQNLFVKWNSNAPPQMFIREAEGLIELSNRADELHVAAVVHVEEPGPESNSYILLKDVTHETSGVKPALSFDEQLGRGIAQLHKCTHNAFGFLHDNYIGPTPQSNTSSLSWPEFFREQRLLKMIGLLKNARKLDSTAERILIDAADRTPQILDDHSVAASLLHGDLWTGNIVADGDGWPTLIDPACYYGDREVDLAMMQLFGGFSQRVFSAYEEAYPVDQGTDYRRDFYNLYHLLNHALLFGGGYLSQSLNVAKRYLK
jgi:fructosamine-3-kinase